jgi:hypothetical protein
MSVALDAIIFNHEPDYDHREVVGVHCILAMAS